MRHLGSDSAVLALLAAPLATQQSASTPFDPAITTPAYPASGSRHPRVRIDEGHFNRWSTRVIIEGRSYAGLAHLLRNDGYVVTADTTRFSPETLRPYDIMIVAGAGPVTDTAWNRHNWEELESFTRPELDAVQEWVRGGGSLLLAVSHAPWGWMSRHLAARFGIDVVSSYAADSVLSEYPDSTKPPGAWLTYTRQNRMLAEHPIVNGRGPSERLNRVRGGGGSSVLGPPGSVAFLALQPTAFEHVYYLFPGAPDAVPVVRSAAGRAQGVAFQFGAGRVVVVSTSHLFFESYMARPGHDNRQMALNVAHWLSGLLTEPPRPR